MALTGLTACITFDFDAMSSWIGSVKSNNPSMISRGEFSAVAVPRLLPLLRKLGVTATFAIPGHTACAFPDLVKAIRDAGHEIAHHGWVHENPASFDRAGEKRLLDRGLEALHRAAGVRPQGYRSPAWDLSPVSVELLLEYGFLYDSSCMAHDFYAYYLRQGDRWSLDEPYQFGQLTELVELPVTWGLDDFPAFEFVLGFNQGYAAPSKVEEIWQGDFDYALKNCPGGFFNLTLHPEFIARGHRITMLERLLRYMADQRGVRFGSLGDYAAAWKQANPMAQWAQANPASTGVNSIREL
jgi:peptidoglycan/xylan/chitin deacetylase (PgdA/CDA1 family)